MEEKFLTRHEIVKAFLYLLLASQIVMWLLSLPQVLSQFVTFRQGYIPLSINLSLALSPLVSGLLWPFVPILVTAMVAHHKDHPVTALRDLWSVFLPCLGAIITVLTLPLLVSIEIVSYNPLRYENLRWSTTWLSLSNINIIWPLIRVSLGLCLMFYPTVFALAQPDSE